MLHLQVVYGKDAGKSVVFRQSVVHIGSDSGNDFQLHDDEISEYHGRLSSLETGHFSYCDLQSETGSRVRSSAMDVSLYSHQMQQSVAIAQECIIQLGKTTLQCTWLPDEPSTAHSSIKLIKSLPLHDLPEPTDINQLSFLLEMSIALTNKTTYESVMLCLAQALFQHLPHAMHISFWQYDSCRDSFSCAYERTQSQTPFVPVIQDDIRRDSLHHMRAEYLHTLDKDGNVIASAITAPTITAQRQLGVMVVEANADLLNQFDLTLLAHAARVASQTIERTFINTDLSTVFDGFIRSIIAVMDARDPASAGHSMRVSKYALQLAQAVHASQITPFKNTSFSINHLDELRIASLLHDIGKVVLKREILLKASKLSNNDLDHLLERMTLFAAWFATQKPETLGDRFRTPRQFERYQEMVTRVKHAQARPSEDDKRLIEEMANTFITPCPNIPLLNAQEKECLLIERGTLNREEREEIKKHAFISYQYLSQIAWPQRWANVPIYVLQHHEKLNGTGYPYGISGDKIFLQSRIITICDIFDALTGGDRPYKTRHSFGEAASILIEDARNGALDRDLVSLFVSKVIPQISDPEFLG